MCDTTDSWLAGEIQRLRLELLDERYARYRLPSAELDQAMVRSLRDYGQLSPIVVCRREETPVLIDGFKRLRASRRIEGMTTLFARRIDADEAAAKAAIYGLNQIGRRPCELEEAWIVHSLVREDGLPQLQVAEMLGRHKSWVCRRLALLEKLVEEARDDLRLGLLSVSAARQLIRLPAGNQTELMAAMRRRSLNATELEGVTDLLLASATVEQKQFILGDPRKALRQTKGPWTTSWDPRLSVSGNRVSKQLGVLLDRLGRIENWLLHRGLTELNAVDRPVLGPGFERLARDAMSVAVLAEQLAGEINRPGTENDQIVETSDGQGESNDHEGVHA